MGKLAVWVSTNEYWGFFVSLYVCGALGYEVAPLRNNKLLKRLPPEPMEKEPQHVGNVQHAPHPHLAITPGSKISHPSAATPSSPASFPQKQIQLTKEIRYISACRDWQRRSLPNLQHSSLRDSSFTYPFRPIASHVPHLLPIPSPCVQTKATCLLVSTYLPHFRHSGSSVHSVRLGDSPCQCGNARSSLLPCGSTSPPSPPPPPPPPLSPSSPPPATSATCLKPPSVTTLSTLSLSHSFDRAAPSLASWCKIYKVMSAGNCGNRSKEYIS